MTSRLFLPPLNPLTALPKGLAGRLAAPLMERSGERAAGPVLEALALPSGARLLEIGFGTGALLARARRRGVLVAGVDPSAQMVARARGRGLGEIRQGTARHLPWSRQSFDAAAIVHAFELFAEPERELAEIARVLVPGGRLALCLAPLTARARARCPNPLIAADEPMEAIANALGHAGFCPEISDFALAGGRLILASRRVETRAATHGRARAKEAHIAA
ncbi:class I SAM-dependent methyltransferase [Pseudoroseicyclus sp. CXY001]|uniref:class I SAM-dependent methyltransferase n=1 Tax=Pseudoroseicyclus sp. CXY001 TaxID=3242492 RepID=UPI00358DAE58